VYRGVSAYCTACGSPRVPLATTSVTLAGQPSKVGGTVARVAGWIVLAGGWFFAALVAGLILFLGGDWAALIAGGPIALITSISAYALLRSGRQLKKSGDDTELATKNQAIFALANLRGGVLKAWDVAQALSVTPKEADDILTKLAKEHPDYVTVDIDDDGNILYRVIAAAWSGMATGMSGMAPNAPPVRVAVPASPNTALAAPAPRARVAGPPNVAAGEPLEEEFETAEPARRKAR
jgi:hypothetical protein